MMSSTEIYLWALLLIMGMMTLIWITGVFHKDASIVDPFWGFGFVVVGIFYFLMTDFSSIRQNLVVLLVFIWGLRLSGYLLWRNWERKRITDTRVSGKIMAKSDTGGSVTFRCSSYRDC